MMRRMSSAYSTRRASALSFAVMVAVLASSQCALALNTGLDINQYVHTAWKIRDGFTRGRVNSIAQTPDGYLWLGTEFGLFRFDGVNNKPWQPPRDQQLPSNYIVSLLVARDGTLWIGTDQGLASWRDGRLTRYDALARSYVGKLLEDREGSIWMAHFGNRWALCRVQNSRVSCFGEDGGPGADTIGLYEDRAGRLWVGTLNGLWRWRPGPPTFFELPAEVDGLQGLSEDDDGSLLMSRIGGIRRFVDGHAVMKYPFPSAAPNLQGVRLLRDRDGGLWVGTTQHGLLHLHGGMTDVFSLTDGLSSDNISSIFEDHEGNIWVATAGGIDRFRESAVVQYSVKQGLTTDSVTSVIASSDGSVWLGTADGLTRWTSGDVTVYRENSAARTPGNTPQISRRVREIAGVPDLINVQSVFEDSRGRVWLSTSSHVGYLDKDRFVALHDVPGGLTRAIVEDGHGNLWIVKPEVGLFRLVLGAPTVEKFGLPALIHKDPITAVAADPSEEGVWLGFFRGGIVYFAGGHVRASYERSGGLAEGRVSGLHVDSSGALWVAADGGVSRVKDGRVTTLTSRNGLPCDAVGWVLEDAIGSSWLGLACGLVRIAKADIDAWAVRAGNGEASTVTRRVQATVFDHADGYRTSVNANYYGAAAVRSSDGKLWFVSLVSQEGVSVVDPARLPLNRVVPPLRIEQITADHQTYDLTSDTNDSPKLPPLIHDLQIDYTALSLVAAEQNQFRYMLEGYDRDWHDAGTRRQAFYTNLRPRTYRFRVIGSNNSGVWNEVGAAVDITIPPAYYQTTWFAALVAGTIAALIWSAHRVRLRIVEKHEGEISALNERLMKAQEQERIRIAGELHDGVMQQMLSVTMLLGAAKRKIAGNPEVQASIDKIQDKLVQAGTEIRQLSHGLHPPQLQDAGLPGALRSYCEQFSAASGIAVNCDLDEDARELSRGASLALFRIVQEALGNAAKHASAKLVTVSLKRTNGTVALTITDDGVGFDRTQLGTSGGLGLVMMRERAAQLNGTFEFDTAPGRGTTIRVEIPFR